MSRRLIKPTVTSPVVLEIPAQYGKHVLFNPQLCQRCTEDAKCERCRNMTCAFCGLVGWKLSADCSVEQFPAVFIWRCDECGVVGLQPILEPDNELGVTAALRKQHREACPRCKVNTTPTYRRVR